VAGRQANILVVDDDPAFRGFMVGVLRDAGLNVLAAVDANSAMAIAREHPADAAVLDVSLPGLSGFGLCRELREIYGSGLPVLFVSGEQTDAKERATGILVGGDDYMVKPLDPDELLARLRRLLERARAWGKPAASDLSEREIEVLQLVAEGLPPSQVATRLVISPKTVSSHVQRILAKLNAHTRAQAVAIAYEAGLIRVEPNGSTTDVEAHLLLDTQSWSTIWQP
jgi:DNA-binding NarL/FixJ family response regulator